MFSGQFTLTNQVSNEPKSKYFFWQLEIFVFYFSSVET